MVKTKNGNQDVDTQDINSDISSDGGHDQQEDGGSSGANVAEEQQAGSDKSSEMSEQPVAGDEAGQWKDKYLRLSAEFDNYRKRTLKEKMDLVALGGEDVISSLLPVLDDIDRARAAMATATDMDSVRTGVDLIAHKMNEALKNKGLGEIDATGQELDTDYHEAVAKTPAVDDSQKGLIVDVVQKGYKLKDKVIRYAKVVVGE